jgi:hypothetical protein
MSNKTSFTIEENLLEALGSLLPGEKSPISLLKGTGKAVTGEMIAKIRSEGITDTSGTIKPEYQHALETLAHSRSFARLKFSAGEKIFEFIVYFPNGNSSPVSLVHNENHVVVQDPPGTDQAFALMDQYIGHSVLASTTFNGEFSQAEALALFALMDLERGSLLHGLADGSDPQNAGFDLGSIMARVTNPKNNFQSLEFVLQSRIILSAPPTQEHIEIGLKSLVGKGMVFHQGIRYNLSDALYAITSRFLIIDSFIVAETGKLDQNNTMWGGSFLSLQAGVNDLLYLEGHAEEVIVKCITAAELLDLTGQFLSDPTIMTLPDAAALPEKTQQSVPAGGKKFCPDCGAQIKAGIKFCNGCGKKLV